MPWCKRTVIDRNQWRCSCKSWRRTLTLVKQALARTNRSNGSKSWCTKRWPPSLGTHYAPPNLCKQNSKTLLRSESKSKLDWLKKTLRRRKSTHWRETQKLFRSWCKNKLWGKKLTLKLRIHVTISKKNTRQFYSSKKMWMKFLNFFRSWRNWFRSRAKCSIISNQI